jgi:hypothetical protein
MDASTRTFFVAGVQFRPKEDIGHAYNFVAHLKANNDDKLPDIPCKLVGEPQNKFDRYAVKVLIHDDFHIGYIPKPINVDVWALRDAGLKPTARLVEFNPDGKTYEMFKVEVTFSKP